MAQASSNYFISYVKSVFVFRTKNAVSEDEQSEPESFGAFSQQGAKCTAEGEVSGCKRPVFTCTWWLDSVFHCATQNKTVFLYTAM